MVKIKPFAAIRPRKVLADKVASRPYDVLNSEEAAWEARDNPYSFYHISKSEIDLPEGTEPHDPLVYEKASENFRGFLAEGILFHEEQPCYYIYALTWNDKSQYGLVCVSSLDDYDRGIIRKHELTRPDKELDRIRHIQATEAQTGNVFLAYNALPLMDALVRQWTETHEMLYDFSSSDGVSHRVWKMDNPAAIAQVTKIFSEQIPCTYIADGHHRAASAARVREEWKLRPEWKEEFPVNYFLTTLFPANQLNILEYNRLVRDLNGLEPASFLEILHRDFEVDILQEPPYAPGGNHRFSMYLEGQWYQLLAREGAYCLDTMGSLDTIILQSRILDPVLGIRDIRSDPRIEFVGGIRGLEELVRKVDSGRMKVAFALYPVTIGQLFDIADQGKMMPPKSTWFEPKLRDGLLVHSLRPKN